jgi:4'-phosphopantetheinyl transferase
MTHGHVLWNDPPNHLMLGGNEVHVWRVILDQLGQNIPTLWHILPGDEQSRAQRFAFPTDRDHFIVTRGMLRLILSRYIAIAPENLRFSYSSHSKPFLNLELGKQPICFNLSHSHGVALYAITQGRQVGVDIECVRHNLDTETIAKAYFSAHEYKSLRDLPREAQHEAFFMCWTRKEAYIKARGEGLSYPLDRFTVSVQPGDPAALLQNDSDPSEALRWALYHLVPDLGYIGAMAIEGHNCYVQHWQVASIDMVRFARVADDIP